MGDLKNVPTGSPLRSGLTVMIPAYNEASSITDTIRSVQNQTAPPVEIIVIDNFQVTIQASSLASAVSLSCVRHPTQVPRQAHRISRSSRSTRLS